MTIGNQNPTIKPV